ncbi:trim71 [Symbiodinium pilosum]|uniref:Trim71 protein n=1 Tax=Symbiodinium pilosum TaxID=2952 RepID=A0A812XJS3_SYMPI|nr:trim71 [Symbiodinium pilosum]
MTSARRIDALYCTAESVEDVVRCVIEETHREADDIRKEVAAAMEERVQALQARQQELMEQIDLLVQSKVETLESQLRQIQSGNCPYAPAEDREDPDAPPMDGVYLLRADSVIRFRLAETDFASKIPDWGQVVDRSTYASMSFAKGPGLGVLKVNTPSSLWVFACDREGARRLEGGDRVVAHLSHPEEFQDVAVDDMQDGRYKVTFLPLTPGSFSLKISIGPEGAEEAELNQSRRANLNLVGEKTYHLHAFLLASLLSLAPMSHFGMASRAESDGKAAKGSDLSEVLPQSCHGAFEDALDFMYSENQAAFEAPASKALLLLKIADILGINSLFDAMGRRIEAAFADTAPLLLEQYCRFHIPGTDDGAALRQIRDGAVDLIVKKFQPFVTNSDMKTALLRLPARVLAEILNADELLVESEDAVFDFVLDRLQLGESAELEGGHGAESSSTEPVETGKASTSRLDYMDESDEEALWDEVRWAYLSSRKFAQALALHKTLLKPQVTLRALTARAARFDLGGAEAFATLGHQSIVPRKPILPPGVPPPSSTEIDFCFHYAHSEQYACGQALRSQPKRIGDVVLRVLVFPAGTDTGVARGSLSVFLEAVPQPHWPRDWEFANIRYGIACMKWPSGGGETCPAPKKKSDLWTFKANRLDRGWHDFLAPGEIHRFLGPDGFVCIRGSLEQECLGRAFLLNAQSGHSGYSGAPGDAAGSSACRRPWVPRVAMAANERSE